MPDVIAFDADVIGRNRTGDETVATGLLTALAARDDLPFTVLAYVRDPARVPEAITASGVVRPVAVDVGSNYRRVAVSLPARLRADRPALYHGNYVLPPGLNCPGVVTVHDSSYRFAPELMPKADAMAFGRFVPWSIRRAARVVTVSEHSRDDVLRTVPGLDPSHVVAIPNGVSAAYAPDPTAVDRVRASWGLEPGYVLFIGALQPRKNLLRLLEAYARVRDTRDDMPLLVLAGDAKQDETELDARIAALRLQSHVRRIGYVQGESALRDRYAAAGVFAFPSLYEGFGLPVAEAMATGTPVLTSDTTALPEVAGGAAVLANPLDVASIADGLARLLTDEALRTRCREAGIVRAAELTWTAAADRLAWDSTIPLDSVKVAVQDGWVTLTGEVGWHFEHDQAAQNVRRLWGVVGVSNQIKLKTRVNTMSLTSDISSALHRSWYDPAGIKVTADGGKVTLRGHVKSWTERDLASSTAWAAPGATDVQNELTVA